MNWILYCFVLHGQDFHSQDYLVEEELRKDALLWVVRVFMSGEAEVNAVFHYEETLLTLVSLQAFQKLTVNL